MRLAACVFVSLIAFIGCSIGSSSEARADLILPSDGMGSTPESEHSNQQDPNTAVSPDLHELMMLVLFNSDIDGTLCQRTAGGASAAGMGSSSVEHGPSPQVALFSRYEFHVSQMVRFQVCESGVFTPRSLISGVFRPPRNAT